jgi:phosphoribosylamine--glycine ligase
MTIKTVLVVGSGGREHALAWKIAQSPLVEKVYVAPGNAGTSTEHKCQNVAIQADAISELVLFAQQHSVDLTVIGPDDPLAQGIVDAFVHAHLAVFGPTKAAAQLEWSKAFTKDFLARHRIPTVGIFSCTCAF